MKTTITKISGFRAVALGTMLAGGLIFNTLARAAEKAVNQVQIPATSAAIWRSIDKETELLDALIQASKFEEVHHRAFAIRDLVAALPVRSGSLPPDKLAQVKTNVQFVATLAQRLDATGDAKDKAGTESNFKKLQGVLSAIRADYPKTDGK
jgi:hypothetical protein